MAEDATVPPALTAPTTPRPPATVTAPVGADVSYDWFAGGTTPAQSGASNSFGFDLSISNSPREIEVFVRTGDCCPVLRSSATLTIASSTTPDPGTPGTPATPGAPSTPSDPSTPGGISLCGIIRALAALALVILFVSVMFVVCPSVLTPIAVPLAAAPENSVAGQS